MHVDAILKITVRVFGITRTVLLYRLFQLASFPFVFLYFIARLILEPGYWPAFFERIGLLPRSFNRTKPGSIWFHAVSVGEVASAAPLLEVLRQSQPATPIYLSTSTTAGRKAAKRQLEGLVDGIFYSPLDFASCVRRVLRVIRPALLIVLETEIWPNLYFEVKLSGAALAIVNGRISDRTWPRYRTLRWLFSPILQLPDIVFVQSATDRDRYSAIGVPLEKLHLAGNLKYDAAQSSSRVDIPTFNADSVWIAASTVGPNERGSVKAHSVDEDDIVIDAFRQLAAEFPRLLLILAPRQPARFPIVAEKLRASGLPFVRRSEMTANSVLALPGILLLNTIGELAGAYRLADLVFVGGSIAPRGGHNIIEPAAAGQPVVIGPNMQNFEAIVRDFVEAGAVVQVGSEQELLPAIRELLLNPVRRRQLGTRARGLVESQRGASPHVAEHLWPLYHLSGFQPPLNVFSRLLLRGLASIWEKGGVAKRARGLRYAASLPPLAVPVVSVGGINVGGSGKTPFTAYLATQLKQRGWTPAILTRGYRRRSPAAHLILPAHAKIGSAFTGDEAQILLRTAGAPIGIGANRYETAQSLLRQFPETNIILLDDGFQHARLHRDLDIVLIDGLDPFGRYALVPLGRLREPLSALARAGAFVVTRCDSDIRFQIISNRLREYSPNAPIFRASLKARHWRDYHSGAIIPDLHQRRVAAFCGLGNPRNFWETLDSLGLNVVFRWTFDDHHAYKPTELRRLSHQACVHGAEILVTTEKDVINFPRLPEAAIAPLSLAWLDISLEIEDDTAFFAFVTAQVLSRRAA